MTEANIYSQGFRPYDGPRTGHVGAAKSVYRRSMRQILGIRRKFKNKVIPIFIGIGSFSPTIVFVIAAALASNLLGQIISESVIRDFLPGIADFFGYIRLLILIAAGYAAPILISDDRRNGMLGVYLSSPLTRASYITSKLSATLTMVVTICLVPPIVLLICLTALGLGEEGVTGFLGSAGLTLVGAFLIGVFFTAIALAVSSISDRRSIAWITYFAGILVLSAISGALVEGAEFNQARLLDLPQLPIELVRRIAGEPAEWPRVDTSSIWLLWFLIVGASAGVVWYRYSKLLVRR